MLATTLTGSPRGAIDLQPASTRTRSAAVIKRALGVTYTGEKVPLLILVRRNAAFGKDEMLICQQLGP
jgi:hypothetical protein